VKANLNRMAEILAEMIDKKGSRRAFAEEIGMPPTTLQSMLTRGIGRASIQNVITVCKALGITVDELEAMARDSDDDDIKTIAAHHDGDEWTDEELETIKKFKEFVRSQRIKG